MLEFWLCNQFIPDNQNGRILLSVNIWWSTFISLLSLSAVATFTMIDTCASIVNRLVISSYLKWDYGVHEKMKSCNIFPVLFSFCFEGVSHNTLPREWVACLDVLMCLKSLIKIRKAIWFYKCCKLLS